MNKEVVKNESPFSKERITSVCCGLVEIDMDDVLLFVHYSAQTFFQGRKELEFNNFCVEIPLACAKYLCMRASESPAVICHSEESINEPEDEEVDTAPFAEYAAEFLNRHFKIVRKPESTTKYKELERYLRKLVKEAPNRMYYSKLLDQSLAYHTRSSFLRGRSRQLLGLAYEGLFNEVENFILTHPPDSEEPSDGSSCTWRGSCASSDICTLISEDSEEETLQAQEQDFFNTACFIAVECGHTKTVEVLLNNGVDGKSKNFFGQPLLHRAVFRNKKDIVKVILDKTHLVDIEDKYQRTAFTTHAGTEHEGNVGVNPSITNEFGWTPLHEASANGHLECVKLLLRKKAMPSPISDEGKTPLDLINSGELHYGWLNLDHDAEHYLNGEEYRKREVGPGDTEHQNEIRELLLKHGAKTGEELYNEDESAFMHIMSGPFKQRLDFDDTWMSYLSGYL
ncbi:hypothetical protein SS1G_08650 [Sclerotinia sclerotiorum 1980 UF-70]|uniref:Uncharacterized protein n=1 Tax=Sclerotinia sclerotiorum (strain ATCC 18683 / 1980 / Ss-1) TaxID=665079 RepID=A7ETJ4_SCLS1|nr:hypothetical protein SS1G_08650 [Sclerotinia sclerotiorum 1980 UF-70]EDN92786.1 hypothetical protein SS1G_08650 [Sclerotinia sclerotiorum 1980 UF-70]